MHMKVKSGSKESLEFVFVVALVLKIQFSFKSKRIYSFNDTLNYYLD